MVFVLYVLYSTDSFSSYTVEQSKNVQALDTQNKKIKNERVSHIWVVRKVMKSFS